MAHFTGHTRFEWESVTRLKEELRICCSDGRRAAPHTDCYYCMSSVVTLLKIKN